MSTDFYVYEKPFKYARECMMCGKGMNDGYLYEAIDYAYFCSSECLEEAIPSESTQESLFAAGALFWTDWHDEAEG